jgi:hypothetical protein
MPIKALKVQVSAPAQQVPYGRGFYQLEEDELFLPVEYPQGKTRFFSFIDSETTSFQLDRDGRLIFIELAVPRRRWKVRENLVMPESARPADIRFLDFRQSFLDPSVFCDHTHENLMIRFSQGPSTHTYYLAENLVAQISCENTLVALWVSDITDDIAGRELAAWRRAIRHRTPQSTPAKVYSLKT